MLVRSLPVLMLVLLAGCNEPDEIRTYSQPKPANSPGQAAEPTGGESRILGAMIPAEAPEWFFKVTATPAQIDTIAADFEKLVKSVKLKAGAEPTYDLPAGWAAGPVKTGTVRQMTIKAPGDLELTITQASGDPAGNVQRWAGQVGLRMTADDLGKYTRSVETTGGPKALIADLKGTKMAGRGGPFMNPNPNNPSSPSAPNTLVSPSLPPTANAGGTEYRILGAMLPADKPEWFFKITGPSAVVGPLAADFDKFVASIKLTPNNPPTFDLPAGWSAGPAKNDGITHSTVRVPGDLLLTVTAARGDAQLNLNRWAGQVGAAGDGKQSKTIDTAGGTKALVADLRGPNNPMSGRMMGGR
jgi:hypothetical protein